jgi:hypothetical protein
MMFYKNGGGFHMYCSFYLRYYSINTENLILIYYYLYVFVA